MIGGWGKLQSIILERYPDIEKSNIKRDVFLRDILNIDSSFDHTTIENITWKLFSAPLKSWLQLLIKQLLSENLDIKTVMYVIDCLSQWIYVHDYLDKLEEIKNYILFSLDLSREGYVNVRDFILKNVPGKYFDIPEKESQRDKSILNSNGNSSNFSLWEITIAKIRYGHSQLPWLELIGYLGYLIEKPQLTVQDNDLFINFSWYLENCITMQINSPFELSEDYRRVALEFLLEKSKSKVLEQLLLLKSTDQQHNILNNAWLLLP